MKKPIGTTFKKENIVLATVNPHLESNDCHIFYKDDNGYIRFFRDENVHFVGDGSDGKWRLRHIVSAWDFYREDELCEIVNDKGEPIIVYAKDGENKPLRRYNLHYNVF